MPLTRARFVLAAFALWITPLLGGGCRSDLEQVIDRWAEADEAGQPARIDRYSADQRRRTIRRAAGADEGGIPKAVAAYRLALGDPDPTVRSAAAFALGEHGEPQDVARLAGLLEDDNGFVRWEAAIALGKLHHPDAVDPLIAALADEDVDTRMAAARALGQYRQPTVFDALVGVLDDLDFAVAQAAGESLRTLTGQDFGRDGRAWLAWARANRDTLFDGGEAYTYQPYVKPPGVIDRFVVDPLLFWRDDNEPEEKAPRGLSPESDS